MTDFKSCEARASQGFTLIEVLLSMAIFSTAMVGAVWLQSQALVHHEQSYFQNIAMNQADMILNKMRDNPSALANGIYLSDPPSGFVDCSQNSCSEDQIAQNDLYLWRKNNASLLPSGLGKITKTGNAYLITIYWDGTRSGATGLNCSSDHHVDLSCYRVQVQL